MPTLVAAAIAKTAVAAPTIAATVAPTVAATGTAAAQTAALEALKQQAIQQGMKQAGMEATKQVALEATKQAGLEAGKTAALEASKKGIIDASMQQAAQQAGQQGIAQAGTQATQQSAVEAAKQGIFSNPAGMPPTAGGPITPPVGPAQPLPPAGGAPNTMSAGINQANTSVGPNTISDAPIQGGPPRILEAKPGMSVDQAQALNQELANASANNPYLNSRVELNPATFDSSTLANTAGPESSLTRGAREAMDWVDSNKINTGLGLMAAGQYMNQPKYEEEDKNKYKSTVDMSEFRPSVPEQPSFTRSYEYQKYQSGGPVEDMSRMNSLGANTGFPMARLQTPAYAVSSATPMPVNTLTPSADASVNTYTGEQRFAEGGISAAERREYGLRTRGERAARNLTTSYEEMEAERQKEAMKLFGERSDPGIVPRSRTQMLSSPFSAAQAEHARLGKKSKVPVVEMPKTNLGDIDNYMDIPIEAASGGIMHGLGGYSDGGRLLRGPGDGVSDSIPAVIGKRQPARLADGEFVIPARIVSELGNGSTEAGARKLYAMMERVQRTRKKSIGKKKVAVNSRADKHLPA
jgi:hypothetical protein